MDPEACCQLKVHSKQHTNLYWSTEPCSGSASQVKLEDFENRLLDNGDLMCDTDEDCFAVAGKNECTGIGHIVLMILSLLQQGCLLQKMLKTSLRTEGSV